MMAIIAIALLDSSCTRHIKPTPAQLSARISIINQDKSETVFYLAKPNRDSFSIAVLCDGSTSSLLNI